MISFYSFMLLVNQKKPRPVKVEAFSQKEVSENTLPETEAPGKGFGPSRRA
jgi:hypothetical protein